VSCLPPRTPPKPTGPAQEPLRGPHALHPMDPGLPREEGEGTCCGAPVVVAAAQRAMYPNDAGCWGSTRLLSHNLWHAPHPVTLLPIPHPVRHPWHPQGGEHQRGPERGPHPHSAHRVGAALRRVLGRMQPRPRLSHLMLLPLQVQQVQPAT